MRFHEIASGVQLPVSSEEDAILDRACKAPVARASLDEREQEVARLMVNRGLLRRYRGEDGKIYFHGESAADIWRDR